MARARVWHWQIAAAAVGAFCCLAAGPCASDPGAQICSGGIAAVNGICGGGPGASIPAAVASPPATAPPRFGGSAGFVLGRGVYTGPNTGNPLSFSGGQYEQFNAIAVYPQSATYSASSSNPSTYLNLSGAVVVAGATKNLSGHTVALIARFTSTGVLDTTFNGTGYWVGPDSGYAGGNQTYINAIAIDSKGRIVVAGTGDDSDSNSIVSIGNTRTFIARYNPDGSLDTTFGPTEPSGVRNPGENGTNSLFPQATGVILGPQYGWGDDLYLAPAGRHLWENFNAIAINPLDNSIYAVGNSGYYSAAQSRWYALAVHYLANGALDTSFISAASGNYKGSFNTEKLLGTTIGQSVHPSGAAATYFEALSSVAISVNPAPSTSPANPVVTIVAGGWTQNQAYYYYSLILQFKQNYSLTPGGYVTSGTGALDTGFNGVGYVAPLFSNPAHPFDFLNSVAIDASSGTIYAAGYGADAPGNTVALIARYNSAGALTGSPSSVLFATGTFGTTGGWEQFSSMYLQPSSSPTKILLGGVSNMTYLSGLVVQLNASNLSLDTGGFHAGSSSTNGQPGMAYSLGASSDNRGFGGASSDWLYAIAPASDGSGNVLGCGSTYASYPLAYPPSSSATIYQESTVFRYATQPQPYPTPTPTATIQAGYLD